MILKPSCYFCGEQGADTVEDIPPRSFFPDNQRDGLIRIPAHSKCNGEWTKSIEYFRNIFTGLTPNNFTAKTLFDTKGQRSLRNSPKLRQKLLREMWREPSFSKSGIFLGSDVGVRIDSLHAEMFVKHMVRGLYYHHQKMPLPGDVEIIRILQPRSEAPEIIKGTPIITIHPKIFKYRYLITSDDSRGSMWVFNFYESDVGTIVAYTLPKEGEPSQVA